MHPRYLKPINNYSPNLSGDTSEVDLETIVQVVEGLDIIAADAFEASRGNPAVATTFVSAPPRSEFSPNSYNISLFDNNNFYVNDVFQGAFNRGEAFEYDAIQGDKITSERGHTGVYAIAGGTERTVELASAANAGKQFFWFAFRGSPQRHIIQALALSSKVRVYGPNPTINADGTSSDTPIEDVTLSPFTFLDFQTPSTGEYYILSTQPVVVTTTNNNLNRDQRVLAPITNELFGHVAGAGAADARISALFANTTVTIYLSDGTIATGTVSPGSPISLHGVDGSPINLTKVRNYAVGGWFILRANGPISGYSGIDGAGASATSFQPLASASQLVGIPLAVNDADSPNDNITGCSEYTGNVSLFDPSGVLIATRAIERRGALPNPATSQGEQLHPADFQFNTTDADITGDIPRGSFLVADVPINVVANLNEGDGSAADDDEISLLGVTPETIRAEIREDANGLKRRRTIDNTGIELWVEA